LIDLRRLRAFIVLAEEQSVTRAAYRLGMQQPHLSRLLRGLENELATVLVQRLARGVRLSEAGKALLDEARFLVERAEALPRIVAQADRGERGRLAIGFTSSAGLHPFVSKALRTFRERLPEVVVTLEEAGTTELVDALVQERLDAAFVRSPVVGKADLRMDLILEEPMLAALPVGHDAAFLAGPLSLQALGTLPLILYRRSTGPGLYDAILAACRGQGISPTIVQEAPRLTATLSLVAAGLGASIVPASMRRLGSDDIAYRPLLDCDALVAPINLVTRRNDAAAPATRLRELVAELRANQSNKV
jgi:DNA-binding transcriptional LysR family regulator